MPLISAALAEGNLSSEPITLEVGVPPQAATTRSTARSGSESCSDSARPAKLFPSTSRILSRASAAIFGARTLVLAANSAKS